MNVVGVGFQRYSTLNEAHILNGDNEMLQFLTAHLFSLLQR